MTARSRELCIMACVFCRDEQFMEWVTQQVGCRFTDVAMESEAKEFILDRCYITSRNELDTNPEAAKRFHELVRKPFLKWKEQQVGVDKEKFYAGHLGTPWKDQP